MPDYAGHGLADYLDRLALHLKLRDVPGDYVQQILDEVRQHVVDTGEKRQDAFGAPAAYAREYASTLAGAGFDQPWLGRGWIARLVLLVVGIWSFRIGATVQATGEDLGRAGVPATAVVWLIALGIGGGIVTRWLIDPFIERQGLLSPRGTLAEPPRLLVIAGVVLATLGSTLLPYGWLGGSGSMFRISLPGWALLLIAVALIAGSVIWDMRAGRGDRDGPQAGSSTRRSGARTSELPGS